MLKGKDAIRTSVKMQLEDPAVLIREMMACRSQGALAKLLAQAGRGLAHAHQSVVIMPPAEGGELLTAAEPEHALGRLGDFSKHLIRQACETGRAYIWSRRGARVWVWEAPLPETPAKLLPESNHLKNAWPKDAQWLGLGDSVSEVMIVPLFCQPPALGILVLAKPRRARHWTAKDLKKLGAFARMTGMALEAFEQRRGLERRIRQSSAVSEIAQNVNTTLDLDILMRLVLLEMTKAMNCHGGDLWLKDEKRQPVLFQTQLGMNGVGQEKPLGGGFTQRALETGEPILVEVDALEAEAGALKRDGVKALMVAPLKAKNKVIGVMHLLAKQNLTFSRDDMVLLRTLTSQAALAIDNARLFNETKRKAQELLGLYEVAQVIGEMSNLSTALGQIVERVAGILNVEKCWFMFYDEHTGELKAHQQAVGAVDEQLAALRFALDAPGVSTLVYRSSRPFYSNEAEHEAQVLAEFKNIFNLRNLMAVPLRSREQTLGVFLAANKKDRELFTGNDVRLFKTLASESTVVIQNANLFNKLRRSYFSIVRVISEMIDARERCSRGHSERVSRYASLLGKQLGLPAETVEAVTIAGLLHDIGKAGISEKLLSKPGALDPAEYAKIKEHASLGEHILESVEIPWDILGLVRHHHEHYNGLGYPDGLAGEAIPLGARILSVAEAFDVMASDRPYHLTRTPQQALTELKRLAGRQFDPAVVAALEAAWTSVLAEWETATERHSGRNPFPEASES